MSITNDRSYVTYRPGGLFDLRIEKDLLLGFQRKLEHCRVEEGKPQLSIQRGMPNPPLDFNPRTQNNLVSDGFQSVVVAWKSKIGEELLVSDSRYEVVGEGGVYEISPGNLTIHGPASDGFVDLLFRPLVNQVLVPQGTVMVHGGAVQIDGKVVLLLGESGKTSLVLSLLARGANYLADECAFLTPDGRCHPYTPYIFMDDRHFTHFPELLKPCFPDARVRRRMEKKMSFHRMGYNFKGSTFVSRQLRELLVTRMYFEGLTCRFDLPFPKAKMPSSGPITHVFHLRATNEDGHMVPMEPRQVTDMESTCAWIRSGHIPTMARLAGMPTIDLAMMQEAFANCIEGAKCYQLRMKLRTNRNRESVERLTDEIMDLVSVGHRKGRG